MLEDIACACMSKALERAAYPNFSCTSSVRTLIKAVMKSVLTSTPFESLVMRRCYRVGCCSNHVCRGLLTDHRVHTVASRGGGLGLVMKREGGVESGDPALLSNGAKPAHAIACSSGQGFLRGHALEGPSQLQ